MNLGSNNPVVRIAVIVFFVGSIAWFGYTMWGMMSGPEPGPGPGPAQTTQPRQTAAQPNRQGGSLITLEKRLDPTLRLDLLKASEETVYKGSGRNIFSGYSAPPPQPDIPKPQPGFVRDEKPEPQGPPPPPPINLKFHGFASRPGEAKKIFLARGDDIFIAGEGDIVARQYRVVRIGPTSVEIEDVLNNSRQSIPLTS